jgi:four helix bundle protein
VSLPHEKLVAYQRADDLFIELHRLATNGFPFHERFELGSQLRRSAYSIVANIVEGMARRSPREKAHFLHVAEASLAEASYCLHAARRLGYLPDAEYDRLSERMRLVGAPLAGLARSLAEKSG